MAAKQLERRDASLRRLRTILVVDDDEDSRDVMAEVFASQGYRVLRAADGIEALAVARDNTVDVAVTDIVMPRKDGLETIQELRTDFPGLGIVALSGGVLGQGGRNYLKVAAALGADVAMGKPVNFQSLLHAVARLCRSRASSVPPIEPP